jgi:hypothetical protein
MLVASMEGVAVLRRTDVGVLLLWLWTGDQSPNDPLIGLWFRDRLPIVYRPSQPILPHTGVEMGIWLSVGYSGGDRGVRRCLQSACPTPASGNKTASERIACSCCDFLKE